MGIKECRKKLQRGVINIAQCEKTEVALHELLLIKKTVDGYVEMLSKKLNLLEEADDATDTKAQEGKSDVAAAVKQGFDTIYEDAG